MDRRTLLKAGFHFTVASTFMPLGWANRPHKPVYALSSARLPDGSFALSAIEQSGEPAWTTPVDTRCHSGCTTPDGADIVLFERRPGWSFHVFNSATGEQRLSRTPEPEEHFYGHGVFSQDGRLLYATASHFPSGRGRIAVFDTTREYRRTHTFQLDGIGPHQIELTPDGSQLVVALGGIKTHPDYDRIKLNLNEMDPALLFIDRLTGREISRHRPSDTQLSCRHLAIAKNSAIYVASQYQGPAWQQPPLIGRHHNGQFSEIRLPDSLQPRLDNYLASIAVQSASEAVVITAPRGGLVVVLDGPSGRVIREINLQDAAGVKCADGGGFVVSSGTGEWLWLDPDNNYAVGARGTSAWSWDNHLF